MSKHRFTFEYDDRGYGWLRLWKGQNMIIQWWSRSGSCDKTGTLVNSIKPGVWTGREKPVVTKEKGMVYNGFGWKFRLWTPEGEWSHYLFHPDDKKQDGTKGCIGLQKSDGRDLYTWLLDQFTNKSLKSIDTLIGNSDQPLNKFTIEEEEPVKYSLAKGAFKSIRAAIVGGGAAAAVTTQATGSPDIPVTAITALVAWGVNLLMNWLKTRNK